MKTVSELEAGVQDSGLGASPSVTGPSPCVTGASPSVTNLQHRPPPTAEPEMTAFNKLVGMMKMSGSLPDSARESPIMVRHLRPVVHEQIFFDNCHLSKRICSCTKVLLPHFLLSKKI